MPTSRTYIATALVGTPTLRIASMIGSGNAAIAVVAVMAVMAVVALAPTNTAVTRRLAKIRGIAEIIDEALCHPRKWQLR